MQWTPYPISIDQQFLLVFLLLPIVFVAVGLLGYFAPQLTAARARRASDPAEQAEKFQPVQGMQKREG